MPEIQAGAVRLYYESHGGGDPLLLINGLGSPSSQWRQEFIDQLAAAFRVITFDTRGTGRSEKPDAPYSIAGMADDAAALLSCLGITRAHVLGISMGSMIAQELALSHPHRVAGLVLVASTMGPSVSLRASDEVLRLIYAPPPADPREAVRHRWPAVHTPEFIARERALLEQMLDLAMAHPTPPYAFAHQSQAILDWHSDDRLHRLVAPTLLITGDRDPLVPPGNTDLLHARIPGSRVHVVRDAGHVPPLSHPEETARVVTEFLRTVKIAAPHA